MASPAATGRPSPRHLRNLSLSFQVSQIHRARPISIIGGRAWRPPRSATTSRWSSAPRPWRSLRDTWPRGFCSRQIHDRGLGNLEAAVAGYRKVIALAGYDGANPYCSRRAKRSTRSSPAASSSRPSPDRRVRRNESPPHGCGSVSELVRPRQPGVAPRILRRPSPHRRPVPPAVADRLRRKVHAPLSVREDRVAPGGVEVERKENPPDPGRARGLDRDAVEPPAEGGSGRRPPEDRPGAAPAPTRRPLTQSACSRSTKSFGERAGRRPGEHEVASREEAHGPRLLDSRGVPDPLGGPGREREAIGVRPRTRDRPAAAARIASRDRVGPRGREASKTTGPTAFLDANRGRGYYCRR